MGPRADGWETYQAGYANVARPGHVPVVIAGTEVIEFSYGEAGL